MDLLRILDSLPPDPATGRHPATPRKKIDMTLRPLIALGLFVTMLIALPGVASAGDGSEGPSIVEVKQTKNGWQIYRNGSPFFIKGGCVVRNNASPELDNLLSELKSAGGNCIRLWGAGPGTLGILDAAHEHGIAVFLGLWMEHPLGHVDSAGAFFDYTNIAAVNNQIDTLAVQVDLYKDHPALLAWGVGNELCHLTAEADADTQVVQLIWRAINNTAAMVKQRDPNHPTVAVTAETGDWHQIDNGTQLSNWCSNIDIWGINAYETMPQIRAKVEASPWDRPYFIPEYGPQGWWSSPMTSWRSRLEHSNKVKADWYRSGWIDSIVAESDRCLGGFAFAWDTLDSPIDTWWTMFDYEGRPTQCIDVLSEAWNGTPPENLSPVVTGINGIEAQTVEAGQIINVELLAVDPEGEELFVDWLVGRDVFDANGNYLWETTGACDFLAQDAGLNYELEAPLIPGAYRLVAWARDSGGRSGVASVPFFVEGDIPEGVVAMPFPLDDYFGPSGFMGASWTLSRSDLESPNGVCGGAGHRFTFSAPPIALWCGVAWQYPSNNWGTAPGLQIMSGGTSVDFLAWSDVPGTTLDFFVGTEGSDGFQVELAGVELPLEPTMFSIPLDGIEYNDMVIGFGWVYSQGAGPTDPTREIYISDLIWNGPPPPPPCPIDLNGDRVVDGQDLGQILVNYYSTTSGDSDVNEDGYVDSQDIALMLENWGPCPE